jgi:prepilin-type N-terminal cleavage/methylation domain-containing protein
MKKQRGFTLIELFIVIAILAIIAAVVVKAVEWGTGGDKHTAPDDSAEHQQ